MLPRKIETRYRDPLDLVWLETAQRLGIEVRRSSDVYAAWDGQHLTLSDEAGFDRDDSLAQMIFHELCHALTEGEEAFSQPDWGLDNVGEGDLWREHACLRLQAALAARHGLRQILAPTTEHRVYYDALPVDPLAGDEPAAEAAREALPRALEGPWATALERALAATAAIARAVVDFADEGSLWSKLTDDRESLTRNPM